MRQACRAAPEYSVPWATSIDHISIVGNANSDLSRSTVTASSMQEIMSPIQFD